MVVSEDGHRVDYTEGKDQVKPFPNRQHCVFVPAHCFDVFLKQQTKSFFFDLAVTSDNIQVELCVVIRDAPLVVVLSCNHEPSCRAWKLTV